MLPLTTLQQRGKAGGGHKIICPKIKILQRLKKVCFFTRHVYGYYRYIKRVKTRDTWLPL